MDNDDDNYTESIIRKAKEDQRFLAGYSWGADHLWGWIRDPGGRKYAMPIFGKDRERVTGSIYTDGIQAAFDQAWGR